MEFIPVPEKYNKSTTGQRNKVLMTPHMVKRRETWIRIVQAMDGTASNTMTYLTKTDLSHHLLKSYFIDGAASSC